MLYHCTWVPTENGRAVKMIVCTCSLQRNHPLGITAEYTAEYSIPESLRIDS